MRVLPKLITAGPDCVPVGWRHCGNCEMPVREDDTWHQCPARFERAA